jgi:hypothetical protein
MAYQQKENSGALFKNDKKEKETHADYRGDINIGGVNYWISGWLKDTKTGGKFLSLAVNVKESPGLSKTVDDKPKHKAAVQQQPDPFEDSDIPF